MKTKRSEGSNMPRRVKSPAQSLEVSEDRLPLDAGAATLTLLRHFEPLGRVGRRQFIAALGALAAGAPVVVEAIGPQPLVLDESDGRKYPPQHSWKVMEPVNIHEIQRCAEKTLDLGTYDYITGGAEDEHTLRDNLDAFFNNVMVMVDDERVRANRLALLQTLLNEFSTIADFSEIVTVGQSSN